MGIIKTHLLHLVRTCGSVERWRKNFKTDRFWVVFGFLTTTHHTTKRQTTKKWHPHSPSSTMILVRAAALHAAAAAKEADSERSSRSGYRRGRAAFVGARVGTGLDAAAMVNNKKFI